MSSLILKGNTSGQVTIAAPDVGNNNTLTLPSTSSTLATQNALGVRNLIINGDMRIAQRGTSVSTNDRGYHTLDRFRISGTGAGTWGTWTQSQDTDVPSGQGFSNSLKMDCTTADASPATSDAMFVEQRIEGQMLQHLKKGTSNAESVTLSFWVKSNKTGTYIAELYDGDNTRQISKSYTIDTADIWEKKTITFAGDTTGTLDNDNNTSLTLSLWLMSGTDYTSGTLNTSWASTTNANRAVGQVNLADSTSNYINITGVQLEVGDTATPFEHRPYDMELARCQRYYYRIKAAGANTFFGSGFNESTTVQQTLTIFPVTMRDAPTAVEQNGTAGDYRINHTAANTACSVVPSFNGADIFSARTQMQVASGLTTGQGSIGRSTNSNAYLAWSAEL